MATRLGVGRGFDGACTYRGGRRRTGKLQQRDGLIRWQQGCEETGCLNGDPIWAAYSWIG